MPAEEKQRGTSGERTARRLTVTSLKDPHMKKRRREVGGRTWWFESRCTDCWVREGERSHGQVLAAVRGYELRHFLQNAMCRLQHTNITNIMIMITIMLTVMMMVMSSSTIPPSSPLPPSSPPA